MYEILGYRPGEDEPSIAAWRARVHPEDVAVLDAGAADPAGPDWEDRREYRLLLPDGSVRWVERRGRAVDDGRRILGTLADVTQRRRRQAQLDDLSTRMGAALTFVVIDDSRAVADLTAELLAERGHRVEVAYEGRSGIEAARRLRPDAVLCDLSLPGMSGRQVAEQLSGDGAGLLLAVTAHAPDDAERRTRAARPDTSRPS